MLLGKESVVTTLKHYADAGLAEEGDHPRATAALAPNCPCRDWYLKSVPNWYRQRVRPKRTQSILQRTRKKPCKNRAF